MRHSFLAALVLGSSFFIAGTSAEPRAAAARAPEASVSKAVFGRTPSGEVVDLHTLTNSAGMEVRVITLAGAITSIRVPDRTGTFADVALGFDSLTPYLTNPP